jgi:predicted component of type VI protein secretion system
MMKRIGVFCLACFVLLTVSGCIGSSDKAEKGEFKAQLKLEIGRAHV